MFQAIPTQQYPLPPPSSAPIDITMTTSAPTDSTPTPTSAAVTSPLRTGPEGKPRKLRASCDACSRAKVKCDKVRPTCHRCGNMGVCCNYSPSMRLGKPRKNRNPDGTIRRDVSPASSCGPLGPRPDMIPRTTTASTVESSPEPMDPFFFGPATPEYHYQDAFMAGNAGFEGNHSPYSDTGSFAQHSWTGDDMIFSSPSEALFSNNIPQFPPPASPYGNHVRSSSVNSHPEMFSPMDSLHHSPPMQSNQFFDMNGSNMQMYTAPEKIVESAPTMIPAPLPTPPTSATTQSHDCTQFAFSTLNSLCSPPTNQPSASDFNGSAKGLPTLDTVLSTNKSAVDKVFVLLGCPCSANPHFSTTIAFTIIKILSWYQAVAGMKQAQPESPIITQMEAFTHTPITVGRFRLEGEDEDTIRTNLVLGELRKVEKLIDKFSERYCKTPADNGIDEGVYGALESLLRTRVRDTFKVTMKNAPEDIRKQFAVRSQQRARTNTIP